MKPQKAEAYKNAGVDIEFTSKLKSQIKRLVPKTFNDYVLSGIGLFGGLYQIPDPKSSNVLVASCDGVGTKLYIAQMMNKHDTVGEDIVNHCVNDILTLGARPLFFLDYIGYSDISAKVMAEIIKGLTKACQKNGCALIGGETAMMPGMYEPGRYELVGFIVGIVDKKRIIDGQKIKVGDYLVGLPSSGLHTNGYSLARKVLFEDHKLSVDTILSELKKPLGEVLLVPHRSYLQEVSKVLDLLTGIAHITGGGFYENISRILPAGTSCVINRYRWKVPEIFQVIQKLGNISTEEMYQVFNMGIGMVLFVRPKSLNIILKKLPQAQIIGRVVKGRFGVKVADYDAE
ncbi:MAG: phosphoribosylformylglycinamidine cyclo-ligase [candidate division WOR-3 bacterium]